LTAVNAAVVLILALGGSQAVASHVQCGDVITKDTTLDSDLIDCPGEGIVIGAPDITLNLGGHTVKGNAIGPGGLWTYGIANGYYERVTVRDGTVRDFNVGVGIGNVTDTALRRLRIRDSHGPGIWLSETHGGLIEGNVVTGFQSAILVLAERMVIRNNVFSGNGGYGIHAFDAGENRIERNIVSRNAGDGIHGFGMGSTLMQGNVIVANGGAGISTDDGSMDNRIDGNRIWDNGGAGVSMAAGAHQNLLEGNSVLRNGASGIFLSYGNGNVFRENRLVGNSAGGIVLNGEGVYDNRIEANRVQRSGGDGIYLGPETGDNAVRRNFTVGNGDDGVDSDSKFNTIARNVGIRNGDLGIEAVVGVTDGGGNRAFANGNPLQCVVVVCR
jgi:parallel beta-helix repeat protein